MSSRLESELKPNPAPEIPALLSTYLKSNYHDPELFSASDVIVLEADLDSRYYSFSWHNEVFKGVDNVSLQPDGRPSATRRILRHDFRPESTVNGISEELVFYHPTDNSCSWVKVSQTTDLARADVLRMQLGIWAISGKDHLNYNTYVNGGLINSFAFALEPLVELEGGLYERRVELYKHDGVWLYDAIDEDSKKPEPKPVVRDNTVSVWSHRYKIIEDRSERLVIGIEDIKADVSRRLEVSPREIDIQKWFTDAGQPGRDWISLAEKIPLRFLGVE